MIDFGIQQQITEQIKLLQKLQQSPRLVEKLDLAIYYLNESLQNSLPVLVCGNGGSAADALHISGELVSTFMYNRRALNVICLNSNVSVLTAWPNDYSFDSVFARQVMAHGRPGGVCWGISTSGNSKNVINAFSQARKMAMKTIAMTGKGGGMLGEMADVLIDMPSDSTPRIQELHQPIYHYLCEQVEARIKASSASDEVDE